LEKIHKISITYLNAFNSILKICLFFKIVNVSNPILPTTITAGAASILTTNNNASAALLNLVGLTPNTSSDQATNLTEHIINLRKEVSRLKATLEKAERDHRENISKIVRDEQLIKEENIRLQRRLQMEVDRREALCRHLSESESSLEMDDERHFNESTRVRTISSPIPTQQQGGQQAQQQQQMHVGSHQKSMDTTPHVERCPTCNQCKPHIPNMINTIMNPSSPPQPSSGSMHHQHHHHLHSMHSAPMNILGAGGQVAAAAAAAINSSGNGSSMSNSNSAMPTTMSNSNSVSGRQSSSNLLNASSSLSSSTSSISSSNRGMTTQTSNNQ
jgi:coiled-coil domain-containing protein 6